MCNTIGNYACLGPDEDPKLIWNVGKTLNPILKNLTVSRIFTSAFPTIQSRKTNVYFTIFLMASNYFHIWMNGRYANSFKAFIHSAYWSCLFTFRFYTLFFMSQLASLDLCLRRMNINSHFCYESNSTNRRHTTHTHPTLKDTFISCSEHFNENTGLS